MSNNKKILICDIITLVCEVLFIFSAILAVIIGYKLLTIESELEKDLPLIIAEGSILILTAAAYIVSIHVKKKILSEESCDEK